MKDMLRCNSKYEPFDLKEVTDVMFDVTPDPTDATIPYRRKAKPEELDPDVYGEPEMSLSFSNLGRIKF